MNFEKRVVGIAVSKEGEPIYSELTTHVVIADEAGGEYVEVQQSGTTCVARRANDFTSKLIVSPGNTSSMKHGTR